MVHHWIGHRRLGFSSALRAGIRLIPEISPTLQSIGSSEAAAGTTGAGDGSHERHPLLFHNVEAGNAAPAILNGPALRLA